MMIEGMNIALLLPSVGGGGAERVSSILSKYLTSKGYNVHFFLQNYDKKSSYQLYGSIHLIPIKKELGMGSYPKGIQDSCSLIKKSIAVKTLKKRYNIAVTISFMEEFNYINILSRWKDTVIIRVCTILSAREDLNQSIYYNKKLLSLLYNRADKVIVMTNYAKRDLVNNYGIQKRKITKIVNPFCRTAIDEGMEKECWIFGDKTVLALGRLDKVKQLWHLIRSFSCILQDAPDAELIFVGKGECEGYLKRLTRDMGLNDKVHFLGYKKNVAYYIKNSKVLVLTSKAEGYPNSMMEGLALGIPVISVDCPGAPREILQPGTIYGGGLQEVEKAKYGILIPELEEEIYQHNEPLTKGEEALSAAVVMILTDLAIYERYHNCYIKIIRQNDFEYIGEKWEELIHGKV